MQKTNPLFIFFLLFLFVIPFATKAREIIHLNYTLQGPVIKIIYDSMTIYTDTNALFGIHSNPDNEFDLWIRNYVKKQFYEKKSDTITLMGCCIPLDEKTDNKDQNIWLLGVTISKLIDQKKLVLFDRKGNLVKSMIVKKNRIRILKSNISLIYKNKDTKEILFYRNYRSWSTIITPKL